MRRTDLSPAWLVRFALAALLLAWRRAVVPAAQPLGIDFAGFARAVVHAFDPVGVGGFDRASRVLSYGWWAVLALTVAAVALTVRWIAPEVPWAAAIALGAIVAPPDAPLPLLYSASCVRPTACW